MSMTAVRRPLGFVGDTITHQVGDATITLQWVRPGAYSVTTYRGPHRVQQQCTSKPTEAEARAYARQVAESYLNPTPATPREIPTAPAATPLAQLAAIGTKRQIGPTFAGAQNAHTPEPQHTALAIAKMCGRVYRGGKPGQVPVGVLKAAARKGFLTLVAKPGTRAQNWDYGVLTHAGERELDRLNARDAQRTTLYDLLAQWGVAA